MAEVQKHGFTFEKWVRDTLFEGYEGSYMQKWDVPPEANTHQAIPAELRSLPVSIKTAKSGSPIGLGDVLRQRQIDRAFLMIVGFWRQHTREEKWFEKIGGAMFTENSWRSLWGRLTLEQLSQFDAVVKNLAEHHDIVRAKAQAWKRQTPEVATSRIVINPKIDSKCQRRVQCSLPFDEFWQHVGRAPAPQANPQLFGFDFPNPVRSPSRVFN